MAWDWHGMDHDSVALSRHGIPPVCHAEFHLSCTTRASHHHQTLLKGWTSLSSRSDVPSGMCPLAKLWVSPPTLSWHCSDDGLPGKRLEILCLESIRITLHSALYLLHVFVHPG